MSRRIFALIPARGGSKGVKRKNLAVIAGRSLLQIAISEAKSTNRFDDLIVSSDAREILDAAVSLGATPLLRPIALSGDDSPADETILHFIQTHRLENDAIVVYLQPTSPLRTAEHIESAIIEFLEKTPAALISVSAASPSLFKVFKLGVDGTLVGLNGPDAPYTARQEIPELFSPNGAIYMFSVESFMKAKRIPRVGATPFVMTERDSLDIDTPRDLHAAEVVLQKRWAARD